MSMQDVPGRADPADGQETAGRADPADGRDAGRARSAGGQETAGRADPAGTSASGRTITRLTDPRALRAYAHPVRMALIGLLRSEGPLTATQAAQLLGESSGTCSFHLRQLARYGLVEEAGGGAGRQKPWRATGQLTDVPAGTDDPEVAAAGGQLRSVVARQLYARLMRWLARWQDEPGAWQQAALLDDRILYLTAGELAELGSRVEALLDAYLDRLARPELRPEDARRVTYLQWAFPDEPGLP